MRTTGRPGEERVARQSLPQIVTLGDSRALLLGPELRYLQVGGTELLRRVHVAVRDSTWGTAEPLVEQSAIDHRSDGIVVALQVKHVDGDSAFTCSLTIAGYENGVDVDMVGSFATEFEFNRVGLCVLLPPATYAGRPYSASGGEIPSTGVLPDLIGPQTADRTSFLPLFPAFDDLHVEVRTDLAVHIRLQGDLFEMEDQRNWTDDSFKIYSTPLARPIPRHGRPGDRIHQSLSLRTVP